MKAETSGLQVAVRDVAGDAPFVERTQQHRALHETDLEPQHARDTRRERCFAWPGLGWAAQNIERRVQNTARQKREASSVR